MSEQSNQAACGQMGEDAVEPCTSVKRGYLINLVSLGPLKFTTGKGPAKTISPEEHMSFLHLLKQPFSC